MFVENHDLLSGIDSVPYIIKQPFNFVESKYLYHGTTWRSESNVNHFIYVIKHMYHVSYS